MVKSIEKVEAYECSDGFLTKSYDIYRRREKVLRQYKNKSFIDSIGLKKAMKIAELSDEDYEKHKEQEKQDKLYLKWKEHNKCSNCNGRGWVSRIYIEYGTYKTYHVTCEHCEGCGVDKFLKYKLTDGSWLKEAKKIK